MESHDKKNTNENYIEIYFSPILLTKPQKFNMLEQPGGEKHHWYECRLCDPHGGVSGATYQEHRCVHCCPYQSCSRPYNTGTATLRWADLHGHVMQHNTAIKKEWGYPLCSDMERPPDYILRDKNTHVSRMSFFFLPLNLSLLIY